jgi:hypothetical protein
MAIFYLLAAFAIGYALFWYVASRKYRREIIDPRGGYDLTMFRKDVASRNYSERSVREAYGDLQDLVGHPVFPSDLIIATLKIDPQDFDALVEGKFTKAGVKDFWQSKYVQYLPISTVEDYVRLLSLLYE